jgi:hypothetical protein
LPKFCWSYLTGLDLLNTTLYDKVCQWLTAVVCGLLLVLQFSLQIKQSSRNCQSCQIWPAKFGQILIRTDTKLVFCNRKLMRTDIFLARTTKPICNFANPDKKTCNHRLQPWATDKLYHIKWYWVNLATGKNQTHNCSSDSHRLQMQMLLYLPKEHFLEGPLPGLKAIWYYYIFVYTCCNIFCLY